MYRVLMGRPEEMRAMITTIGRWEDIIKMDFQDEMDGHEMD